MIYEGYNPDYHTSQLRYSYTSLVRPSTVYEYDMSTGKSVVIKQTEVMGGYDPAQYHTERIFARANDGTMVPMSIVYRKGLNKEGNNPCYLYGYGSYGISYWEPAKWVARLRAMKTDHNRVLLHTNMGSGHGGSSGRFEYLKDIALEYAFAIDALSIGQER
jgi:oligopeptidase B